jgi:subfamily B ATP-binding cassette protein MsbA
MDAVVKPQGNLPIIRRLLREYMRGQWRILVPAIFCMVLSALMTGALAWLLDPAIKLIFLEKRADMLVIIPLAVVGVIVLRAFATFGEQTLVESAGERIVATAQRRMFDSIVHLDLSSLNAVHSGQFISKFLYDATLMREAITKGVAGIAKELVSLIALAGVMIYQNWRLALISVVVLPGVAWVTQKIGSSMRRASSRGMEETGGLTTVLSEALDGRRIVKAQSLEGYMTERAQARIDQRLRYLLRVVRARSAAVPASDLFAGVVIALTIFYAGYQSMHGQVQFNEFASFIAAMLLAQQPVRNLTQLWAVSSEGLTAANRLFSVIDSKPQIVDAPGSKDLVVSPAPGGGAIRFNSVDFAYHGEDGSPAVRRVSFDARPGTKIALVGPSGAGKTTLFNLLLRFYETNSGSITIDGQDIRNVTLASLRKNIALVTQEPVLFDETIAENISIGNGSVDQEDIEVAARAGAAHEFISRLPEGYDTRVGEGGLKLSGGQRQRVAIARAMLRDAPILLLDEATSSLDTESEKQVQDALSRLMKDRTTIVIAHRLSTVIDADQIFVMDHGEIVEAGTHQELLARGALYQRLYSKQFQDQPAASAADAS